MALNFGDMQAAMVAEAAFDANCRESSVASSSDHRTLMLAESHRQGGGLPEER